MSEEQNPYAAVRNFEKKAPAKPKRKRAAKSAAKKQGGGHASEKESSGATSRQLQGQYIGMLKKFPKEKRTQYQTIAKQEGREKAIKAMERDLHA